MSDKEVKEMVELLWGITDKLDKITALLTRFGSVGEVKAGDSAAQMSIDPEEPK